MLTDIFMMKRSSILAEFLGVLAWNN